MQRIFSVLIKIAAPIVFVLGASLAFNALAYANFQHDYGFLKLKQAAISTGWYLPAYYSHVLFGGLILIAGFLQIHPSLGLRWKRVHRAIGYFYVMGILFFSAPGGMIMSFFIDRGPVVLISFVVQCTLWFLFTALAFNKILNKDIAAHRLNMYRSFALTFAAITLRIYIFIASYLFDLTAPWAYGTIAWLSWAPNILIVEWTFNRSSLKDRLMIFKAS